MREFVIFVFSLRIMRISFFAYFMSLIAMLLWHDIAYSQTKSQDGLDYIEKYHKIAMIEMQEYKIPASITLAQGILESGNGKSELAKKSNNHFGIKCHKNWTGARTYHDDDEKGECFRVYDDPAQSYRDHSIFLTSGQRYAFLFDLEITDYKAWAKGLKQAGYATLPVYANVLINLIELYDLTQYDHKALNGPKVILGEEKTESKTDKKTEKGTGSDTGTKSKNTTKTKGKNKSKTDKSVSGKYTPYKLSDAEVVGKLFDGRYIRENNGVKFIYAKAGDDVYTLADGMEIYDYQLIKYNNLGNRRTFNEKEIVYIEPKKNKAARQYKYHIIEGGETLSYVSRLYAVKLESIFKMNNMDETTILRIGTKIRLR